MNILFVTYHFLDEVSGGSYASLAYINAFSEISDSCMLLYPERGKQVIGHIHNKCIPIGIFDRRNKIKKTIDLLLGRIHRYYKVINLKVNSFNPDIIVFDNSQCSSGHIKIINKRKIKIITIHHNYMAEYYKGTKPYTGWKAVFLNSIFLYYMKKTEKEAVLFSDLNLTLTNQDVQLLYTYYNPKKTSQIINLGCFEPEAIPKLYKKKEYINDCVQNKDICFIITGSLSAYQSEFSITSFFENFYPELTRKLPESKLIIAGKNPSNKLICLCNKFPSVKLIANPMNMQEVIALANIYICPTCVGGGLKLRVMDGLKAGLPVISHFVSARGYEDFKDANCMFVYEDKFSFNDCLDNVIKLIDTPNTIKNTVLETYESKFSFGSGVERVKNILATL